MREKKYTKDFDSKGGSIQQKDEKLLRHTAYLRGSKVGWRLTFLKMMGTGVPKGFCGP